MTKAFELAETVNQTNYADMSYNELVTLNFAYLLAVGDIKPLIVKKRAEEMEGHTDEYVARMDNYGASKAEILTLIEKKVMRDKPYGTTPSQDVDDQTPTMDVDDNQDKGESVLALPESFQTTAAADEVAETMPMEDSSEEDLNKGDAKGNGHVIATPVDEDTTCCPSPQETEIVQSNDESTSREINIEDALELFKKCPLPSYINVNAPYFVERSIVNNGSLEARGAFGNNLEKKDLEEFRSASEKYVRLFLKKEVKLSTKEYLVYDEGKDFTKVRYYHIPEQSCEDAATTIPEGDANNHISAIEEENIKEKRRVLKKAIKLAKEMSFSDGTDANVPFYDRYTFRRFLNIAQLKEGPKRFNEDATTLSEIMPAFETFAKYYNDGTVVLTKDNCIAAMVNDNIYLVLFNIPKIPAQKKRRGVKKSHESAIKEMFSPVEDPLISKAIEMTKALPVGNGTDVNAPYFVQCELSVIGDGELLLKGKPFSKNMSGEEELAKLRKNHLRFAKTMKANDPVSTDEYIAYFWNGGKNLSVFYYNTKGIEEASAA